MSKSLAFFSVVVIGLGLFATVIYQSGLIQSLEKNKHQFMSLETMKKHSQETKKDGSDSPIPLLSNPNGNIAIAIIRPKPNLENMILDALENDSFEGGF